MEVSLQWGRTQAGRGAGGKRSRSQGKGATEGAPLGARGLGGRQDLGQSQECGHPEPEKQDSRQQTSATFTPSFV